MSDEESVATQTARVMLRPGRQPTLARGESATEAVDSIRRAQRRPWQETAQLYSAASFALHRTYLCWHLGMIQTQTPNFENILAPNIEDGQKPLRRYRVPAKVCLFSASCIA